MATAIAKQKRGAGEAGLETLVAALNEDLAAEYAAVIMYRTYASKVQGPFRRELREFFSEEIADELGHAQVLADKIVALGGEPTTDAAPVKPASEPKRMLENVLAEERRTVERYVEHRRLAEEAGQHGLAVDLDDLIQDETRHRDETRMMLARWE